jgi:triacylglycerol lipase
MSILVRLPDNLYDDTAFAGFSAPNPSILDIGRAMMWMSQLAYENDQNKITNIGQRWNLTAAKYFQETAKTVLPMSTTRGVIAQINNTTIISFAGTDPVSLPDWIADLRFQKSVDQVHEGCQDAVEAVWKGHLEPALDAIKAAGCPVIFAGHSLGGALAAVTAERALREKGIQQADVYTFGMPRVGTALFAASYAPLAQTTYRFMHGQDIVPTVPPREFGFVHVGRPLPCQSGGKFSLADLGPPGEPAGAGDVNAVNDFVDQFRRLVALPTLTAFRGDLVGLGSRFLTPGIADHLPDRYCHALS